MNAVTIAAGVVATAVVDEMTAYGMVVAAAAVDMATGMAFAAENDMTAVDEVSWAAELCSCTGLSCVCLYQKTLKLTQT